MKINNNTKKFIYLISPNKIYNTELFYRQLEAILKLRKIYFFQLRLKNSKSEQILQIGKKVKKLCKKYGVKFIINDDPLMAKLLRADGCHLGQKDGSAKNAKKQLKNKIIGVTCHNSKSLAKIAVQNKADYLAFGSFNKSKLKPNAKKANLNILKWAKRNIKKPIIAIGGINNSNYKKFIKCGAKYIALSSYIWDNPKLKPEIAIRKFK